MNFNYFSCMDHGLIVDENNLSEHNKCNILGEMFKIKSPKKKVFLGLIGKSIIEKAREEQNIIKYEKRELLEKKKKTLAQARFEKQIPDGHIVINLSEMNLHG